MIRKVIQSYGSLSMIRILSRVFQFILKTYLIRNLLDKEILGHMVHLDIIVTISLHLIKSCIKPGYQKVSNHEQVDKNIKSGMNLMNLGILATCFVSLIICTFQLYHYQNLNQEQRLLNLNYCIMFYGVAVINQACFEKYNVANVLKYSYVKSAVIQMLSFLPKTLFIFIAAQTGMFQKYGILVFGMGHFLYTALLFLISYFSNPQEYRTIFNVKIPLQQTSKNNEAKQNEKQLLIGQTKQIKNSEQNFYFVDQKTKQASKQFFTLSILKLGIQQFQKIALVALDVSSFSSIYILISNLGSIVVRYVFAPLEQIVYNYFSRGDQKQSVNTLILLIKWITLFSCLSLTFGYNFSESFLGFLYGQKWVDADSINSLQIYTILLSVLGINGIMEAFLFAKGIESLKIYKYISIIPTIIYILLSFYFINHFNLGTGSFFLANSISMIIRIIISWNLQIKKHISLQQFFLSIKPSNLFLVSIVFTFLIGNSATPYIGMPRFNHYFKDMIIGGILFSINLAAIAFQNRKMIVEKVKTIIKKKIKDQ